MAKVEKTNEGRVNATVTINWSKYRLFNIEANETLDTFLAKLERTLQATNSSYLNSEGFYMLILGTPSQTKATSYDIKDLSYIGKAKGQNLGTRIPQRNGHEAAFNCIINNGKSLTLYVGLGVISENSIEVATAQLYDDVECCLIFTNKPSCNENCKETFNSQLRRSITIHHTGYFHPLIQDRTCE